jgi:hypothetical protein
MRVYIVLILAAELAICLSSSCSTPAPVQPAISGPVKVVEFPEPWVKQKNGASVGVNDAVQYVVRKSTDSKQELLFAVKQGFDGTLYGKEASEFPVTSPDYDYYSDNRFAVSIDGQPRIKRVTEDEWNAGEKLLQSYYFINKDDPQVRPEGVRYNERLYRKAGESWGNQVALVSPQKTRIAIFSYTSREKVSESIIPGLKSTEPGSGEVFLDVYDLSSGEKVGVARSPYGRKPNGFAPSMIFGASVWIEDTYIVMPLDPDLSRSLIGMFPDK